MDQPRSKSSEETTGLQLQNREEIDFYRSGICVWFLDRFNPPLCTSGQFFFSVLSCSFLISPCSTYFSVFMYFFFIAIMPQRHLHCLCGLYILLCFNVLEAFSQWVSWESSML